MCKTKTHPLLEISRALLTHIEERGFEIVGNMPYSGSLSEKPSFVDMVMMFNSPSTGEKHGVKIAIETLNEDQLACLRGSTKAVTDG